MRIASTSAPSVVLSPGLSAHVSSEVSSGLLVVLHGGSQHRSHTVGHLQEGENHRRVDQARRLQHGTQIVLQLILTLLDEFDSERTSQPNEQQANRQRQQQTEAINDASLNQLPPAVASPLLHVRSDLLGGSCGRLSFISGLMDGALMRS